LRRENRGRHTRCGEPGFPTLSHHRRRQTQRRAHCRRSDPRTTDQPGALSHAVGVGEPLSIPETRAMMVLRANSLSKGFSGVRGRGHRHDLRTAHAQCHAPGFPSQGQRGPRRGDLAPLCASRLAAGRRRRVPWMAKAGPHRRRRRAEKRRASSPLVLEAKEAGPRSLTVLRAMLAVGTLSLLAAENSGRFRRRDWSDGRGDALKGNRCGLRRAHFIARVRPPRADHHCGLTYAHCSRVASFANRTVTAGRVQGRPTRSACMPQVHGAVRDTLAHCRFCLSKTETNSRRR